MVLCALCSRGIVTCVFIVLYSMWVHVLCGIVHRVYMYELCCISGVYVCILRCRTLCADVYLVM